MVAGEARRILISAKLPHSATLFHTVMGHSGSVHRCGNQEHGEFYVKRAPINVKRLIARCVERLYSAGYYALNGIDKLNKNN